MLPEQHIQSRSLEDRREAFVVGAMNVFDGLRRTPPGTRPDLSVRLGLTRIAAELVTPVPSDSPLPIAAAGEPISDTTIPHELAKRIVRAQIGQLVQHESDMGYEAVKIADQTHMLADQAVIKLLVKVPEETKEHYFADRTREEEQQARLTRIGRGR